MSFTHEICHLLCPTICIRVAAAFFIEDWSTVTNTVETDSLLPGWSKSAAYLRNVCNIRCRLTKQCNISRLQQKSQTNCTVSKWYRWAGRSSRNLNDAAQQLRSIVTWQ